MTYTIKNFKNIPSDYGDRREDGYRCTIYREGVRLGTFHMPTNGGVCPEITMADADRTQLIADARDSVSDEDRTLVPRETDPASNGLIVAMMLEPLIEAYEQAKQMKRWCKKQTLFTVSTDEEGSFRILKTPYGPRAHAQILRTYGDQVTGIWNAAAQRVL